MWPFARGNASAELLNLKDGLQWSVGSSDFGEEFNRMVHRVH